MFLELVRISECERECEPKKNIRVQGADLLMSSVMIYMGVVGWVW